MDIASRGYRMKEPQEAPRESSQVLGKVFAALRDEGVTKGHIAQDLHVRSEEIDALVFGLTLTGLSGGSTSPTIARKRSQLRVVK